MVSYRLLLHPLRNYPGPLAAKLTDAYAGVLAARKQVPLVVFRLHEKYGKSPIVPLLPLAYETDDICRTCSTTGAE